MHKCEVPAYAVEGAKRRRGRQHLFETIDSARTALVVIDMQNVFLEEGAPIEVPYAREIVPGINKLAAATRESGGTVVWVQMTQTEACLDDWSVFFEGDSKKDRQDTTLNWLTDGDHGHEVWGDLDTRDGDLYVRKNRYSAFLPGSSDIEDRLRERGIDTVIIVGTLTKVCCECSARDAMMRNFKVIFVADANATRTDEEHNATLGMMAQIFGDVRFTDETVRLLRDGAKREAAE